MTDELVPQSGMNEKSTSKYKVTQPDKLTDPPPTEPDKVPLPMLFRYATKLDFCLMFFGALLAATQGTLNSTSSLIFRHLMDALIIDVLLAYGLSKASISNKESLLRSGSPAGHGMV
ncbi:hypothetical protein ANCCEY_02331 [Ancylostoma ceylanicum]|uniref:Uncharacterized protein n=1 Tax=Ancylostoma ceylanicum TaxID=53326 RepID=A0A0D6M820_9BILA|nr:hypothetical protein ANCCEY_02331 [Ancylostoma ceylanicum]